MKNHYQSVRKRQTTPQKLSKNLTDTHRRACTDGQINYEKGLNIITHQENAN